MYIICILFKFTLSFNLGLNVAEAAKLCNYMHFRAPVKLQEKSLLAKANLDPAIDFIDAVDEDIPKGILTLHLIIYHFGLYCAYNG